MSFLDGNVDMTVVFPREAEYTFESQGQRLRHCKRSGRLWGDLKVYMFRRSTETVHYRKMKRTGESRSCSKLQKEQASPWSIKADSARAVGNLEDDSVRIRC